MRAFAVAGVQPKNGETAVNHLAQVAAQPIVTPSGSYEWTS
jgi:hypothetical protein